MAGDEKTAPDLPDEPTFSLLRKAWQEFATGAHTLAEMGRLMQSWGLASINGKSFAPQSLSQLFTNGYYAGVLFDPWVREEHEGKHVPMVTREEFARVQQVISGLESVDPPSKGQRRISTSRIGPLQRLQSCLDRRILARPKPSLRILPMPDSNVPDTRQEPSGGYGSFRIHDVPG